MLAKISIIFLCLTIPNVRAGCLDVLGVGHMESGETKPLEGECASVYCYRNEFLFMKICPEVFVLPPCEVLPEDNSVSYPDCCPKSSCPEDQVPATSSA